MAEAVLFNVAEGILKTLGSQLFNEIKLLSEVNDELVKFSDTVSAIQAVLLDAEEKFVTSRPVREWLRQLKEAMYDAENLLDDFSTEALQRKAMHGGKLSKEVRLFFSSSNQLVYGLKMAHKIKDMRTRLNEIAANRKFQLVERPLESVVVPKDRLQTHSRPPPVVVGREGDKEALIELLLSTDYEKNVETIPIVGIGGLGKTTLAQLVFADEKVRSEFKLRFWVCVADDFDVKLIVRKIICSCSCTKEMPGDSEMEHIVDVLDKKINRKKYLLVLDDVWNQDIEKWGRLKNLLSHGARGSRILVTTRLANVAKMTRASKVYELQGLREVESWSLFAQMAFEKGEVPSQNYKEIGEKIVAKCSGVPLAIKVIGGLLYFKTTISEWSSFANKELLTVSEGDNSIFSVLKLSYDHLSPHLKHCFAYCSLFPKDHLIDVPKLINLWMAQGYVNCSNPDQCPKDIGLEYFMDLLWKSFFQEVEKDYFGNIKFCKMHDLMHDLAIQVAGPDIGIYGMRGEGFGKKIRHISFCFDSNTQWKLPCSLVVADDVRTFLLLHRRDFEFEELKMDERQWDVFSSRLRHLRSLELHSSGIDRVPSSISKLKHLRYLDLSFNSYIKILPDSITKLYNLQVLKLKGCFCLSKLPKDIYQLVSLCELDLAGCQCLKYMPRGLVHLTSLHTLTSFVVARDTSFAASHGELQDMNNLRGSLEIIISANATCDLKAAKLQEKQHLESLSLWWKGGTAGTREELEVVEPPGNLKVLIVQGNNGLKMPKWISSLKYLVKIELSWCYDCQYIPPLHHLPYLEKIKISFFPALDHVDSEESTQATSHFFPSLKILELEQCPRLKGWWKRLPTTSLQLLPRLHRLSNLVIWNCPNLASMPLFPPLETFEFLDGSLQSLKDILKASATAEQMTSCSASSSSSSSLSTALSQLQKLRIFSIEDLEFLPQELFCNMSSLKSLVIECCDRLKAIGPAVGYLTSLESLDIRYNGNLNLLEDEHDDHWQALRCLRTLLLVGITLESLPQWLQHCQVLHSLEIVKVDNLISLPDWMPQLTSLQRLEIRFGTPQLVERCGNNKGQDWPCIAHIPSIKVNDTVVKRNGRYML